MNLLVLVSCALGVVFGLIYAISGFTDSGKSAARSKNPRVKNLTWLLGGGGGVILGDWKLLSPGANPPDHLSLLAAYLLSAVATAIISIAIIAILVALTARARARRNNAFKAKTVDLVLDYIHRGYAHFRTRLKELDEAARDNAETTDVLSRAGEALGTIMALTARERAQPNPSQREHCIDQTLKAMEDTIKLFATGGPALGLKSNYMAAIAPAALPAGIKLYFTSQKPETYAQFLVLRRYRDGHKYEVALPVEGPSRLKHVLPGAPACVALHQARLINTAKPIFEPGVPETLRKEIREFFKTAPYQSVLSVPLIWQSQVTGVANFESNLVDLVDRGPDLIPEISLALTPYSVLLGELVQPL